MKILITGSKGFIGSHLVPVLKKKNKVREWDLYDGNDLFSEEFEKQVKKSDVVIHLAALTNVNQSFEQKSKFIRVNVLGTARVCELVVKYGKKLIYPSSAAIYHRELSPYSDTKYLAEQICASIKDFHPVVILRFFNIFGLGMNPSSGSVMYEFLKGIRTGKIVIFGDGEQTRDFINIRDVVNIIQDSLKSKWNGSVVDVGTGQAYSINYVAGLFAHYGNVKLEYEKPRREIKWSIADIGLLKKLYKKKITTNLEKDILEIVKNDKTK